ncbi:MAG: cardiolipin synthase [Clostridia bacterium]|nr:cardiolipin synthase [Clostridia bacterium]
MKNVKVKNKRGIPFPSHVIFSAFFLILQLAFLFGVAYNFTVNSIAVFWIFEIIAIITVATIINRRGNPNYKIAWIIFILIFPIFGISLFMLFGGGRVLPHLKNKMRKSEQLYVSQLEDDSAVHETLRYEDLLHSRQADYLTAESGFPLYKNTSVEYLSPGEAFLPRFLEELNAAEKYIYIEFFIIAEGKMWDSIASILERKVREGVEVKVLFDDFGSIKRQNKNFISRLRSKGIKVAAFNKIKPSFDVFMNNRNHRKIVVIDGKVAVTGGLNLADEYINEYERFGYWMDCAVILKGEAVKSFLAMFCSIWKFTTGEEIDMQSRISDFKAKSDAFVLPYSDDPLDDKNPAEGIYMQMLNTAQRYVYIATPYLIIDDTMIDMLKMAANSGVDVRILTPHIPDKWYVHPVTQYNYLELLEAGVKIYEYTPGFIHSKIFVSDDRVATVGTVNMDYRSFVMHFECGVWFSDNNTVMDIKSHFNEMLKVSQEIEYEKWRKSPWYQRLKRAILHIFSPFM